MVAFDVRTGFRSDPLEVASGSGPVTLTMVDRRERFLLLDTYGLRIPARDVTVSGGTVEDVEERLEYRPGPGPLFPEHYVTAGPRTVYLPPGPLGGERGRVVAPDPRYVEGQVIDQETGEPLRGALVRRVMADLADHDADSNSSQLLDRFTVTAGVAGRFRYPWAMDGTPVLVTHPGFGRRLVLLSRDPRQRIGLDRTPSISVSVASDALVSCVAVQNPASRDEGLRYVAVPRGETVNVDGLLEGRWTLHLGCDPDSRPVRTLEVQAGRRYPVALEARRSP